MTNANTIINIIQISLFILSILVALIYLIPVLLIHRFHTVNNAFTVNFCFAVIVCCSYWLVYYIIFGFYPQILSSDQTCKIFDYFQMMCTSQVSLATVEVSVHRVCSIVYHTKPFFKKKRWTIICIGSQWASGIIFALPTISFNDPFCGTQQWTRSYTLIIIVIIPLLICFINNMIIFNYVRSSTNRIQPTLTTVKVNQQQHANRRDLHLLRHMIIMFCIFLGGWSPIYTYTTIVFAVDFDSVIVSLLILLAELSILFDMINLFLYNHELRRYLQEKLFKRRQT